MKSLNDLLQKFWSFYNSLYTSSLAPNVNTFSMYPLLDTIALDFLSDSEREFLVSPITPEEVQLINNSFTSRKAPGPDGLTIEILRSMGFPLLLINIHSMVAHHI